MLKNLSIPQKPSEPLVLEGGPQPTEKSNGPAAPLSTPIPSPEVKPSKPRRSFSAKYKLSILDELDRCTVLGEKGAILRREGLYSSQPADWKRQRDEGALTALNQVRGRKKIHDTKDQTIADLKKERLMLQQQLAQAEAIIDVQKKVSVIFWHQQSDRREPREEIMKAVDQLSQAIGIKAACTVLGIPRATYYRWQKTDDVAIHKVAKLKHPLALCELERQAVLNCLHSPRFVDKSPGEIVPTLLDEGVCLCSERTMYRILEQEDELKARRQCVRKCDYQKPELLATGPNQVWSWDITKLKGPRKWSYYYLYAIIDIYSRYTVGWMLADRESAELAKQLISKTCQRHHIQEGQLTLHADRGASMKSKPVAFLLADLGLTKTHSRPYTSDDNPYSESQFKALKYCPQFPERFGCMEDAKAFCRAFFQRYKKEHRHSGINRLTPISLHYGYADGVLNKRNQTLASAFEKHPL